MEPFTEEQKAVLRQLAIFTDRTNRNLVVRFMALVVLLAKKGIITLEELESAIAEREADLALQSTMEPEIRSLEDLFGEGPQEEKGR